MMQFLFTNLFWAPNILNDDEWAFVQTEIGRDFPWLLTEKYEVYLSGIGQDWNGWSKREQILSHAGFKSTPFNFLNAVLAWLTHLHDALCLANKGPIVVLAPTPESGLGATLAKVLAGNRIRLVVRVQGHAASRALYVKRSKWRFTVMENIERLVMRRGDLVIPMGRFTYDLAISQGARPEKTIILPFPVRWANCPQVTDLPENPVVLFVGRLEREKGIHLLLQAMTLVRKRAPDVRLLIAGDGSYRSTLEELTDSLGIRGNVFFLGWLQADDLQSAYRNSWLVVLPSLVEEGLGMVLVESGLMGRPVIASDIGGIRDIVRHGENGFLVPPGDPMALADAIVTILKDRHLASRMGTAGSRLARDYLEGRKEALKRVRQAIYGLLGNEAR